MSRITRLALASLAVAALCGAGVRKGSADCPHTAASVSSSSSTTGTPTLCGTTMCNFVETITYSYSCITVASSTECVADNAALLTATFSYACDTAPDPDRCNKTQLGQTNGPGTANHDC